MEDHTYLVKKPAQEESTMSETKNFFEGTGTNNGWNAGLGALFGGLVGSGGLGNLGGNNRNDNNSVTPDQLASQIGSLRDQINTDQIQDGITALSGQVSGLNGTVTGAAADIVAGLGCAITGVKDAVISGQAQTNLALCGLGHNIQAGFSGLTSTILQESARGRELTLQTENSRLQAANAALQNQAGHTATQVMLTQVINAGKA